MANDVMFEGKERRIAKIEQCLAEYGLASLEEARALCQEKGFDPYKMFSRLHLRMQAGHILWAVQLR